MLVMEVGPREAARRMNLNENTVLQWTRRNQWLESTKPTPAINPLPLSMKPVITVISPSDTLADVLKEHGDATKLGLAKASRRAVESTESMDGQTVLEYASKLKDVATIAEKVHGWGGDKAGDTINSWSQINVTINE